MYTGEASQDPSLNRTGTRLCSSRYFIECRSRPSATGLLTLCKMWCIGALEDDLDTISIWTKIRVLEIVPDIQQMCWTESATCMASTRNNYMSSDIPCSSRSWCATDIWLIPWESVPVSSHENAVSAAVSAADLIWRESGDSLSRADSFHIGSAADTAADTASSDPRKPALILWLSVEILVTDKLRLKGEYWKP
jgi:hypothetical protein